MGLAAGYDDLDNVPTQTAGTSPVLASDWNTYVRDNFDSLKFGHVVVASSSALPSAAEGTMAYVADTNKIFMFNGSAWCEIFDLDNVASVSGAKVLRDVPAGVINPYAGSSAPDGWLLCNGATLDSVANTQYADLYAIISTNYGGTGASSFNVPDLQGRVPVGKGTHVDVDGLGDNDGISTVAYRRPKHKHSVVVSETSTGAVAYDYSINQYAAGSGSSFRIKTDSQAGGYGGGSLGTAANHTHSVGVTVGDQTTGTPTDVVPYVVTNYIIKY